MKKSLVSNILQGLKDGKIKEPFDAEDVKKVFPGYAEKTYKKTLVQHRKGNPINKPEYFNRLDSGKYCLISNTN